MPISINWLTKVIHVPQSYLTPVGPDSYELDVNQFRLDLKNIEDGGEGMYFEDTHRHNTEVVLAGVTYARTFEVINGYQVEFEDGQYQVRLYGANHNLSDVKVLNSVSIIAQNSAGLQTVNIAGGGEAPSAAQVAAAVWTYVTRTLTSAAGLTTEQATQLAEVHKIHGLKTGVPLVVAPTTRTAGDVSQSIGQSGDTVTITRQ
jgi:hypothetical protein